MTQSAVEMELDLRKIPRPGLDRNDVLLFSESQNRFVVTIEPSKKKASEALIGDAIYREICMVTGGEIFRVNGSQKKAIIEANIFDLKEALKNPLNFLEENLLTRRKFLDM